MTRILHVLDHSLPLHSGYTFRTRAILKAQEASGLTVRGVTGTRHTAEGPEVETVDGLTFSRTAGEEAKGKIAELGPIREWSGIARFADAIERAVEEFRPDVLHAHSPCALRPRGDARRQKA